MNQKQPFLYLIPWDHKIFSGYKQSFFEHYILIPDEMADLLNSLARGKTKGMYRGRKPVFINWLYNECLNYDRYDLEEFFQRVAGDVEEFKNICPDSEIWFLGHYLLLKEFQYFFDQRDICYLEPNTILSPNVFSTRITNSVGNEKMNFRRLKKDEVFFNQ